MGSSFSKRFYSRPYYDNYQDYIQDWLYYDKYDIIPSERFRKHQIKNALTKMKEIRKQLRKNKNIYCDSHGWTISQIYPILQNQLLECLALIEREYFKLGGTQEKIDRLPKY